MPDGRIENAVLEMERMGVKIMGLSEVRWPGAGYYDAGKYEMYYSSGDGGKHRNGVGVIVCRSVRECVTGFVPISERIMLLRIGASPMPMNIIQVYAPTSEYGEEEVKEFYSQIEEVKKKLPKREMTIVMGDFNAKIGKGRDGECVGPYGLGKRNKRGDQLSLFASERLVIMNTFFTLPVRRLYTWKSPRDTRENIIRNQIDYILIDKRHRQGCISVKTYPGADLESDHVPFIGTFRMRPKRMDKGGSVKVDMGKLREPMVRQQMEERINEVLRRMDGGLSVEEQIERLSAEVRDVKGDLLKFDGEKRKSWMTGEILQLMEKRRVAKGSPREYKAWNTEIRRRIRVTKDE